MRGQYWYCTVPHPLLQRGVVKGVNANGRSELKLVGSLNHPLVAQLHECLVNGQAMLPVAAQIEVWAVLDANSLNAC